MPCLIFGEYDKFFQFIPINLYIIHLYPPFISRIFPNKPSTFCGCSYGFPVVWSFSHGFPTVFPMKSPFSHGFPMVFPMKSPFSHGFSARRCHRLQRAGRARRGRRGWHGAGRAERRRRGGSPAVHGADVAWWWTGREGFHVWGQGEIMILMGDISYLYIYIHVIMQIYICVYVYIYRL